MSKRSQRLWRGFAVAAAFFYLVAMFVPWNSSCYESDGWLAALAATFTDACGGWASKLGIVSVVLCYLIIVFALLGPRRSALSLESLRTALSLALVAVTILNVFWCLPGASSPVLIGRFAFRDFGQLGYGAWLALGSSLALLLAFLVLDAGGLRKLFDRLPAWAQLDRLEAPGGKGKGASERMTRSRSERSNNLWSGILILAPIAYVLSLLTDWWTYSAPTDNPYGLLDLSQVSGHLSGFEGVGEFCALIAIATAVAAGLARRGRERRFERVRNGLVALLAGLTLFNILALWNQAHQVSGPFQHLAHSRPDYGALAGLVAILAMLLAAFAPDAGGWTKLIDRLNEPSEHREKTT